jgi:hypothetical protein
MLREERSLTVYKRMFSYWIQLFIYVFTICHYSLCVRAFMIKSSLNDENEFYHHFGQHNL